MSACKAEVRLDHKTGPVVITIAAQDPKVAAYMANRLKELFGQAKTPGRASSPIDDLMRSMGIKP